MLFSRFCSTRRPNCLGRRRRRYLLKERVPRRLAPPTGPPPTRTGTKRCIRPTPTPTRSAPSPPHFSLQHPLQIPLRFSLQRPLLMSHHHRQHCLYRRHYFREHSRTRRGRRGMRHFRYNLYLFCQFQWLFTSTWRRSWRRFWTFRSSHCWTSEWRWWNIEKLRRNGRQRQQRRLNYSTFLDLMVSPL